MTEGDKGPSSPRPSPPGEEREKTRSGGSWCQYALKWRCRSPVESSAILPFGCALPPHPNPLPWGEGASVRRARRVIRDEAAYYFGGGIGHSAEGASRR